MLRNHEDKVQAIDPNQAQGGVTMVALVSLSLLCFKGVLVVGRDAWFEILVIHKWDTHVLF